MPTLEVCPGWALLATPCRLLSCRLAHHLALVGMWRCNPAGDNPPMACLPCLPSPAGPTTAAGMAAAKGWRSSLVPALLIGIMGYATATVVGVACAAIFQRMNF